jgi:hypothetical protein
MAGKNRNAGALKEPEESTKESRHHITRGQAEQTGLSERMIGINECDDRGRACDTKHAAWRKMMIGKRGLSWGGITADHVASSRHPTNSFSSHTDLNYPSHPTRVSPRSPNVRTVVHGPQYLPLFCALTFPSLAALARSRRQTQCRPSSSRRVEQLAR